MAARSSHHGRSTSGPPHVRLDIPPHVAWLQVWGHASDGWWALITWREYLTDPETHVGIDPHLFAAWAAAGYLEPERNADRRIYADVRRIALPDDRSVWPRPPEWEHDDPHYLGILDGTEPEIPPHLGTPRRGMQGSAYD